MLMKKVGGIMAVIPWGTIGRFASKDGQLAFVGLGIQVVGVALVGIGHIIDPDSMPIRWSWGRTRRRCGRCAVGRTDEAKRC